MKQLFILSTLIYLLAPASLFGAPRKACLKSDSGKIVIKRRCKESRGLQELSAELLQGLGASQVGPQGPQGPTGPAGPEGQPGQDGSSGLLSVIRRKVTFGSNLDGFKTYTALCEGDEIALGGGGNVSGDVNGIRLLSCYPDGGLLPTAWKCTWVKEGGTANQANYNVYAVCGKLSD